MNTSEDKKPVSVPEVVSMMSKIKEDKLTNPNYSDWSKKISLYLRSLCMTLLQMIQKTDGWRMMHVFSYIFVIPMMVKYSLLLITMSMLRN